jgi:hypothetical protein
MAARNSLERVRPAAGADPESWMDSVRSLIEQENLAGAKALAAEAAALFPDDSTVQQMHRFFRPYKVSRSPVLAKPSASNRRVPHVILREPRRPKDLGGRKLPTAQILPTRSARPQDDMSNQGRKNSARLSRSAPDQTTRA